MNNYDDIINTKYPFELKHPRMSTYSRAGQFAPFAALTGYGDSVKEEARFTYDKIDIDDDVMNNLNWKLQIIRDNIKNKPNITFRYFVKDNLKEGGKYISTSGRVKKIDEYLGLIILDDNKKIIIDDIVDIISEEDIFNNFE